MQYLPTRLPIIVLQSVEEKLPPVREVMVRAVCLCADKTIISSYSGYYYVPKNNMFPLDLMLPFIFCGVRF
jgi:hypothetical protein